MSRLAWRMPRLDAAAPCASARAAIYLPKLSVSVIVTDKNGSLLSFLRLGDDRKTLVSPTAFADTIAALNQPLVDGSPFELSAEFIALVDDFAQFCLVLREERAIEEVFWNSQRCGVIGGQIEAGQVAIHSPSHLNLCFVVHTMNNHIIDVRFDFQAGFAAGVYDKQMMFCGDFKVV